MTTSFSRATPRERQVAIEQRYGDLKNQREKWMTRWREITKYISPFSGRYDSSDHQESRDYDLILDDHAGYALNILVSGMASGATSPLRPWFKLTDPNDLTGEDYETKEFLGQVQTVVNQLFHRTNTYNSLHQLYRELCLFGTAADLIYDHPSQVMCHHVLTAGEYCIGTNQDGEVDTLYREFELTVAQAVKMFGYKNLSRAIQAQYDAGKLEEYFKFLHAIEPRVDRDYRSRENLDMPWASYYIELQTDKREPIRESGFEYFPALCPRWDIIGADPYGSGPTFNVLPDAKELQQVTLRKQELLDMYTHPPIEATANARQNPIDISPGAINFIPPSGSSGNAIKPIISSYGDLNAINETIQSLHQSIERKYYVDMFLMLRTAAGDRKTTVEVSGLQEEQRLILGPVTERLSKEVQRPLIQITIHKAAAAGLLPQQPERLRQSGFEVDIQSVFAQAQRAVDINAYDRFLSTMQAVAAVAPDVLDRVDVDGLVDEYADRLNISVAMLKSRDEAEESRQARAQAQQQQQQTEQAAVQAQADNYTAQAQKAAADASSTMQQLEPLAGGSLF